MTEVILQSNKKTTDISNMEKNKTLLRQLFFVEAKLEEQNRKIKINSSLNLHHRNK